MSVLSGYFVVGGCVIEFEVCGCIVGDIVVGEYDVGDGFVVGQCIGGRFVVVVCIVGECMV